MNHIKQAISPETIVSNKKAYFNYEIEDKYVAGFRPSGSEVKSIKEGNCSIKESFCYIKEGEIYIKNMYVKNYKFTREELDETRDRKILLTKQQIKKITKKLEEKGYSLIPTKVLNVKGWIKIEVGLGKGKKLYDKKNTIKEKDIKKDMNRSIKNI
jgi:SsrA-binding protein